MKKEKQQTQTETAIKCLEITPELVLYMYGKRCTIASSRLCFVGLGILIY